MIDQENIEVVVPVNHNVGTTTSRSRYFTRMNPLEFHDFKVKEDHQEFIDKVYKVLMIMGETPLERKSWFLINLRVFLKYYSINGMKEGQKMRVFLTRNCSKLVSLINYFSLEISEAKVLVFISLIQGNMNVRNML